MEKINAKSILVFVSCKLVNISRLIFGDLSAISQTMRRFQNLASSDGSFIEKINLRK